MPPRQGPILVVDDEFLVADLLTCLLEDEGFDVLNAANGAAALSVVREKSPALVITDYMMPRMTGLELAQAIAAEPGQEGLPVILVSAAHSAIARSHAHLFVRIMQKPYQPDDLLQAVHAALAGAG